MDIILTWICGRASDTYGVYDEYEDQEYFISREELKVREENNRYLDKKNLSIIKMFAMTT